MDKPYKILIADRNPHIRKFLRRELDDFGYEVRLIENSKDLLRQVYSRARVDLLIFDPDFPGVDTKDTFRKILDRIPQLPVVLYCVRGTENIDDYCGGSVFLVEKNGNSIEVLKETIQTVLLDIPVKSSEGR
jgi:DNA-binding NtrC family response regulator